MVDSIHQKWTICDTPIHKRTNEEESRCTKVHDSLRKDIERPFGVIQARFHVLEKESHLFWKRNVLAVNETCVILHNMLDKMSRELYLED